MVGSEVMCNLSRNYKGYYDFFNCKKTQNNTELPLLLILDDFCNFFVIFFKILTCKEDMDFLFSLTI